jgi:hypothetical protein
MFVPLIIATTMPLIPAVFAMFGRYMQVSRKTNARHWSFGYSMLSSGTFLALGIIHFSMHPEDFDFSFAWQGGVGSLINVFGSMFAGAAIGTGAAIGPMIALLNTQMVIMTIISALITAVMPNSMQLVGLALGLLSAFVLTIPDIMYGLWFSLTMLVIRNYLEKFRL